MPSALDGKHQKLQQKLSKLQGAEFDRAYMDAMVDAHKDAEKLLKRRAGNSGSESASNMSDSSTSGSTGATGTSGASDTARRVRAPRARSPGPRAERHAQRDRTSGDQRQHGDGTPSVGTPGTTGTSGRRAAAGPRRRIGGQHDGADER